MVDALIIDACRTPRGIGKAGKGALAGIHPQQLGATVLRSLADRAGIDTAHVDDIIWGTSSQRRQQSGDLGRMSALDAGYDVPASAVTLDRFRGSGITSVNMAANAIMSGSEVRVIARLRDDGVSILLIEQNARAALRVSNHAYVIEGGAIRMYGEASKIAADPRVVDAYLGGSMAHASDIRRRQSERGWMTRRTTEAIA